MSEASQPEQEFAYGHLIHDRKHPKGHVNLQDIEMSINLLQPSPKDFQDKVYSRSSVSPDEACEQRLSMTKSMESRVGSINQKEEPKETTKSKQQDGLLIHLKCWVTEWIFSLLSIIILVALIIILRLFDGKPAPSWPFGLTLNTIAALLSTICRATVLVPVTEGLSQIKWNWMAMHSRPLRDLYFFDQASRWPFWSVRLLPRLRGRFIPLVSIASVVLVVSLVTSSVTQSAIGYRLEDVLIDPGKNNSVGAMAPVSREYPGKINTTEGQVGSGDRYSPYRKKAEGLSFAAFQGFLQTIDEPWPEPVLTCGAMSCSWPQFSSLAVCHSMRNITDQLNNTDTSSETPDTSSETPDTNSLPAVIIPDDGIPNNTTEASPFRAVIPNAVPALSSNKQQHRVMNMTVAEFVSWGLTKDEPSPYHSSTYGDWGNDDILTAAISQFHLLYTNPKAQSPNCTRAFEIFLHFCVKTYNVTAENTPGKAIVVSSTTKLEKVIGGKSNPEGGYIHPSYTLMAAQSQHGLFNITTTQALHLLDQIGTEISGTAVISGDDTIDDSNSTIPLGQQYITKDGKLRLGGDPPSMLAKQVFSNVYAGVPASNRSADTVGGRLSEEYIDKVTEKNIHEVFGNVASAMTAYLRTRDKAIVLEGSNSYERVNMIVIRWEWISFLVIQIVLTIVFQVIVVVQTARLGIDVVKSSNIAEIFALQSSDDKQMGDGPDSGLSNSDCEKPIYRGINTNLTDNQYGELVKETDGWKIRLSIGPKLFDTYMTSNSQGK